MKSRLFLKSLVTGALAVSAANAAAPSHGGELLLVANQTDRTLSVVDVASGRQLAAIPVGGVTGHEVAASPDGKLAYVPIYGNAGVGAPGTDGSTLSVIDLAPHKIVNTVDFGHGVRPHKPLYEPALGKLYVTTELDNAITVIDPKTMKIEGKIPTGAAQSHMLVVSRDGKRGYTANVKPGSVSVLDMAARKLVTVIPISGSTQRISITPDDRLIFTSDQTQPREAVIDAASNTIKQWIPLPAVGYGSAVTPNGKYLLVCMPAVKQVAVVDLATMKVVHTIDIPNAMGEIVIQPDGKDAFISCFRGHQVAQIDTAAWKVVKLIDVGQGGDGMTLVQQ